jgi:outer membrane protein TolC
MRFFANVLVALALAAASGRAAAQQTSPLPPSIAPEKTLTWDDCVAFAAQKNPALVSAEYAEQAGHAAYMSSFNGLMPSVTLSDGYFASNGSNRGAPGYSAQAAASVNLFNMGEVASIKSASANYTQTEAALRLASANLRFSLRQAFAQAFFAEKNIDVARKILDIQQKNAEEVALRYQSGNEYKGNMMNAKAQVLQAEATLFQLIRSLRTARRSLDAQLGFDEFSEVAATGTVAAQAPPDFPAHMEDFVSLRPDVAVQKAVVKIQLAAVDTAESPLWPSVTANYARSRSGNYEFPDPNYGWTAGATLSLPLFAGGPTAVYYNVKAAKRSWEKSEQDLRTVRNAAIVDLENTWAAYANAVDQLAAQDAALDAARQRDDEGAVRYASGLLTYDNFEVIISEWVSAEQQAIQARLTAVTAQAAWEKSLGKALGE